MEQLVILLIIGAISLVKWLLEKSAEQRARRETEERIGRIEQADEPVRPAVRPIDAFPGRSAADRKFREALGLPVDVDLPPPRQEAPPLPPSFRIEEVEAIPASTLREAPIVWQEPPPPPKRVPKKPAEPLREVRAARHPVNDLLRERGGLRKAILVQEILGTPKGLVF